MNGSFCMKNSNLYAIVLSEHENKTIAYHPIMGISQIKFIH